MSNKVPRPPGAAPQIVPTMPLITPLQNVNPTTPQPCDLGLAEVPGPGGQKWIVMQVALPSGVTFVWIDKAAAKQLGQQLQAMAGGILVAPANSVPLA